MFSRIEFAREQKGSVIKSMSQLKFSISLTRGGSVELQLMKPKFLFDGPTFDRLLRGLSTLGLIANVVAVAGIWTWSLLERSPWVFLGYIVTAAWIAGLSFVLCLVPALARLFKCRTKVTYRNLVLSIGAVLFPIATFALLFLTGRPAN
jgi:hypothetical protein